ncbi:MAG: hypothetical protein JRJ50_15070, partial [Deltaproteobacteria bacterium]|nr:hypothetical protein [Deltaproteobacteria bacterium]
GTGCPGAAKIVATTRFPLNGTISESVGSMRFALNLKGAGFDHMIITGRAKKPTVLCLGQDRVSLLDATDLWGLDIFETTDALKKSHGGEKSSVIAIGPSGENRVVFSMALVDKASTLGRGGLGAVMGSKNLKAIIASGDNRPKVYDPKELKTLLAGIRERLKKFKNHPRVLELGIMENWDNYIHQLSIISINCLCAGVSARCFRLKRQQRYMDLRCTAASRSKGSDVPPALLLTRIIWK